MTMRDQLNVLTKRLERERKARRESEAVAEKATRELYEALENVNRLVEQRTAELERANLELRQLADIVESSNDAIIGNSLDGIVTSWNPGAERLYGYTAEEMIGNSVARLSPDDRQEEPARLLDQLKNGQTVEQHETLRVRKDGTKIDITLAVSPIRDSQGHVVGTAMIGRNISEQRRARVELARYAAELERTNADLEEFNKLAVGRELRMIELETEVNELCRARGKPPRYNVDYDELESPTDARKSAHSRSS